MNSTLWTHEARRVGLPVLAVPVAATVLGAALVAAGGGLADRVVPGAIETLPALGAGIAVVAAIGRDPARELLLSLPTGYGGTLALRITPVLAATAVGAALLTTGAVLAGAWHGAPDVLTAQLVWLAPVLFLSAVGALATMATASAAWGTAVVAVLWVLEAAQSSLFIGRPWQPLYLFADGVVPAAPFHDAGGLTDAWWRDRWALCLAALAGTAVSVALARRPERLLRGALCAFASRARPRGWRW